MEPKKTTVIFSRLPDPVKAEFKRALGTVNLKEAYFLRSCAEALIALVRDKKELSLPIRLLDDETKQAAKKRQA